MPFKNNSEARALSRIAQAKSRAKKNALKPARVIRELNLTPTETAYIAGFFDGEGSVGISKASNKGVRGRRVNPNYSLHIKFSNSDRPVLEWIAEKVGGWILEHKVPSKYRRHWKFVKKGSKAMQLLQAMLPYLIVKKEQAEKAIEFQTRQSAEKNRYEAGRQGPVPRTVNEIAYKEHYFQLLKNLKMPQGI